MNRTEHFMLVGALLFAGVGGVWCQNSTAAGVSTAKLAAQLPWVYSQVYGRSPLHTTVAELRTAGATALPKSAMSSLWRQGVADQDLSPRSWMFPVYVSTAADPVRTFRCTKWGACNADGLQIHVPAGALPEMQSDGHIGIIDTELNLEIDGWQCEVRATTVNCSWGGKYELGGDGLDNSGSNAVHAGFAAGLFVITAQELVDGKIEHGLGLLVHCLNDPTVYPADRKNPTDASCHGKGAPSYGNLLHLTWTPEKIAASGYSQPCKTILVALATYGAYTMDTGNGGLALLTQHQFSYLALSQPNPWTQTILPALAARNDAKGTWWNSCLNRLAAGDFELLEIAR
jgi:hypothetical protein